MKDLISIALATAMVISLTACTTAEATNTDNDSASSLTAENEHIIEGKVTKVNGNEIDVDLGTIKTAQRQPSGENSGAMPSAPPDSSNSKASGSTGGGAGNKSSGAGASGSRPEGAGSRPEGAGSAGGTMPTMGASTTVELTGESKTIKIPVGTPVYMTVRGTSSKVDFTRISKDNIVKINMNDEEKVLSVTVVS